MCNSSKIPEVMNLGDQPPANSLYKKERDIPPSVPLRLMFCEDCFTVQLGEDVDPEYLFANYLWITGTSNTANQYSHDFVKMALSYSSKHNKDLFVVEVASNDGTFLKQFQNVGCRVLGIDPATNIALIASKKGIPTEANFFSNELAKTLVNSHGYADFVYARNVIPHVKEIHSVLSGIETLLTDEGVGIIEFHNAGLLLEELHYDYIYHEHLFYYTLTSIDLLLKRHGLYLFDVSLSPISGGSWVVYFSREQRKKSDILIKAQSSENETKYNMKSSWINFSKEAKRHSNDLSALVKKEVSTHGKIVAYGASARSSTLLNYCGLNSDHISVIIDKNPLKHGLFTAGSNIPIVSYEQGLSYIKESAIILLLAWNFKNEIIDDLKSSGYKGSFIIPLPGKPQII
ncbi:class I SAM-dependent methyltransferase [Candidatus Pseudothioglobus singularis]|nr:class I SAM-dependent methyltransferase [Candidatus Pseudothioglobus singularis]